MTAENQSFSAVQKLDASHDVDAFDCGKEPLDRFLQRYALVNQKAGSAQTYVVCRGEQRVVGYYSLAVGAVEHADAPGRVSKGLARHPIPVMLLARLAIDRSEQGKGLGKALLKDALLRTAQAADIALDLICKARDARRITADTAADPGRLRDDDGFRRD